MQVTFEILEIVWSFYGWWIHYWNFESNVVIQKKNTECLDVKEKPYRDFVKVDNFISPILHNQINLGNNFFHNLLDYRNEYIEKLLVEEDIDRNSLMVIDSSIHEKVKLRE